jgi:hypothetical protein
VVGERDLGEDLVVDVGIECRPSAVAVPHGERANAAAQRDLATLHDRLWSLIKAEAQVAEREVAGHGVAG